MDTNTAEADRVTQSASSAPFFTKAEAARINEAAETAESVREKIFQALSAVQTEADADAAVAQAKEAIIQGDMTTTDFRMAVDELSPEAKGQVMASPELDETVMPMPDFTTAGINEFDIQEAAYRGNVDPGRLNQAPQFPAEDKAA